MSVCYFSNSFEITPTSYAVTIWHSVQRGESILLFYNTKSPSVVVEVFRSGYYGGLGARQVLGPVEVPGREQITPRPDKYGTVSCQWKDPFIVSTQVRAIYAEVFFIKHIDIEYFLIFSVFFRLEFLDNWSLPCKNDRDCGENPELCNICY